MVGWLKPLQSRLLFTLLQLWKNKSGLRILISVLKIYYVKVRNNIFLLLKHDLIWSTTLWIVLLSLGGKKAVQVHAAVWVPDGEATVCMHCKKTQFTLINRRHHCRKCGAVVCGPCSNKRFLLPNQSSKPLRVCLSCYNSLTSAKIQDGMDTSRDKGSADSSGEDDSDDDEDARGQPDSHDTVSALY